MKGDWYGSRPNKPINSTDPTGLTIEDTDEDLVMSEGEGIILGEGKEEISDVGCVLTAYTRIANAVGEQDFTLEEANNMAKELGLFTETVTNGPKDGLTPENGAKLINALLGSAGIKKEVLYSGDIPTSDMTIYGSALNELQNSPDKYYVTARLDTVDKDGNPTKHTVNLNSNPVVAGNLNDPSDALNVKINDTSGVRNQISNDIRKNTLLKSDYFRVVNKGVR
ncbi:MAG: hypothetical protein KA785_05755 [Spirochaetaceae bacterium]|nr:hypothetical protein [Spirochaetaceae bacterium]